MNARREAPHREKRARRALRARGGRFKNSEAEDFLKRGFFGGECKCEIHTYFSGVLVPPTRRAQLPPF